jgi:hypothetical protein
MPKPIYVEAIKSKETVAAEEPKPNAGPFVVDPFSVFNLPKGGSVHDRLFAVLRATKDISIRANVAADASLPGTPYRANAKMLNRALKLLIDTFGKAEDSAEYRKKWLGTAQAAQSQAFDLYYASDPGLFTKFEAAMKAAWEWQVDDLKLVAKNAADEFIEPYKPKMPLIGKVGLAILGGSVVYYIFKKASGPQSRRAY